MTKHPLSDLHADIRDHIERETQDNIEQGMTPEEARYAALRKFGNVTLAKEDTRAVWVPVGLEQMAQDARYAIRMMRGNPGFSAIVILTLALGISLNNTMFTIVNVVMLRGLPFADPERVVALGTHDARSVWIPGPQGYRGLSYSEFRDWQRSARAFAGMAASNPATMNVSEEGFAPDRFEGAYISAEAFGLIGRQPVLGRDFRPEDDRPGAAATVILGHRIWTSRYGADPRVVGRTIRVNAVEATIIGIMPVGFQFPATADIWQPLSLMPGLLDQSRQTRELDVFGRLADGTTMAQARADLSAIAARLAVAFPDANANFQATVAPYRDRYTPPQINAIFLAMMGAVGFVLLIACVNAANLLLARSVRRSREIAIRVSLGGTRWRIIRQLLVESVMLALLAGVAGLGLSAMGLRLFEAAVNAQPGKPYWLQFSMDGQVFAFLAGLCLGTGLLFGFAPALHVSKAKPLDALKDAGRSGSGRRARRWSGALVMGEIALALVLLAGAGFMMRSFLDLYRADPGIDTSQLITMRLELPHQKYPTPQAQVAFYQRLEERLDGMPGVSSVSLALSRPFNGGFNRQLVIDGRPSMEGDKPPTITAVHIGPRYFETLRLPLLRGRAFSGTDGRPGEETAIVDQHFVAQYFPNEDPIERRIRLTDANARGGAPPWLRIVGVARNLGERSPENPPQAVVYLPYRLEPYSEITLIAHDSSKPGVIASRLRSEVRALDPDLPLFDIQTMDEWMAFLRWPQRVFGSMFSIFACIALVLCAVGLHAVTAQTVTQRTQEIGIRLALGAQARQIWWMVMRRALLQVAIGLTIGLPGALGVGHLLHGLWVDTSPRDPITLVSIALLLALVTLGACAWPTLRASRLDPLAALRYE